MRKIFASRVVEDGTLAYRVLYLSEGVRFLRVWFFDFCDKVKGNICCIYWWLQL
jgi:hypothetical protein